MVPVTSLNKNSKVSALPYSSSGKGLNEYSGRRLSAFLYLCVFVYYFSENN